MEVRQRRRDVKFVKEKGPDYEDVEQGKGEARRGERSKKVMRVRKTEERGEDEGKQRTKKS